MAEKIKQLNDTTWKLDKIKNAELDKYTIRRLSFRETKKVNS